MRRLGLCFLLLFLAIAAAAGDPLSGWFDTSPSAGRYESVRQELVSIVAEATGRGVPAELMASRVAEGAEKRVAPEKLVTALRKDLADYSAILSVFARTMQAAPEGRTRAELLSRGGLALRAGMDIETFERAFAGALRKGAAPRRAVDALVAVAAVDSRMPLDGESEAALAASLASSAEKEDRFSQLASLLLRGKAGRLATRDLVVLAVSVFDSGGGFLQLESEISRRLK